MNLWKDAVLLNLFGTEVYAFGFYCAIGALAAAVVLNVLCREGGIRKGGAACIFLLCAVCGILCSRIAFCLLNRSLGGSMPFTAWFRITEGGWSMAGLIGGILLGARLSAGFIKESRLKVFDYVCCSIPLLIAAEKIGESKLSDFDISRPLAAGFPALPFFTVQDPKYTGVHYLATHRIGMILAIGLFLTLAFFLTRPKRRTGDTGLLFLLLCGAGGILLESLRYDHFLEFSFVRLEQVFYACLLAAGTIGAVCRYGKNKKRRMARLAIVFLIAAVAGCIAIEFALDRTGISHLILYAAMILLLSVPVILSIRLLSEKGNNNA